MENEEEITAKQLMISISLMMLVFVGPIALAMLLIELLMRVC